MDEAKAFLAAGADPGVFEEDDEDLELESTDGLDDVERVGEKCCLHDFRGRFRSKKRMVSGTIAAEFELAT